MSFVIVLARQRAELVPVQRSGSSTSPSIEKLQLSSGRVRRRAGREHGEIARHVLAGRDAALLAGLALAPVEPAGNERHADLLWREPTASCGPRSSFRDAHDHGLSDEAGRSRDPGVHRLVRRAPRAADPQPGAHSDRLPPELPRARRRHQPRGRLDRLRRRHGVRFPHREAYLAWGARLSAASAGERIIASDEERFLERSRTRAYVVEEYVTSG